MIYRLLNRRAFVEQSTEGFTTIDVTCGGNEIIPCIAQDMLCYNKIKLGGTRLMIQPIEATAPDQLKLSSEIAENKTDVRDLTNLGGCYFTKETTFAPDYFAGPDSLDNKLIQWEMLKAGASEGKFSFFNLNYGTSYSGIPLVKNVQMMTNSLYPGTTMNVEEVDSDGGLTGKVANVKFFARSISSSQGDADRQLTVAIQEGSSDEGFLLDDTWQAYGWQDIVYYERSPIMTLDDGESSLDKHYLAFSRFGIKPLPKFPLFTVIIPPAFKTARTFVLHYSELVCLDELKAPIVPDWSIQSGTYDYVQPLTRTLAANIIKKKPGESAGGIARNIIAENDLNIDTAHNRRSSSGGPGSQEHHPYSAQSKGE